MNKPERFRKTTITEGMRWDPDNPQPVIDWLETNGCHYAVLDGGRLGIGTLESGDGLDRHAGKPGDMVLRGGGGEFYCHDADLFAKAYERV